MKRCTRSESIIKRQEILNACADKQLSISELAESISLIKTRLNHHLLNLVNEGYLSKNPIRITEVNQSAYAYKTINFEPYEWMPDARVEEKPTICNLDYDPKLMLMMGYTKITPVKGYVYRSLMA
jgi:hypothetical protein